MDNKLRTKQKLLRTFEIIEEYIHLNKMAKLALYLVGYRTFPLLKVTQGMGGTEDIGIKDFIGFLLGYRGYTRIDVKRRNLG